MSKRTPVYKNKAEDTCKSLILAYAQGEANGGSVEWSDLDAAFELAKKAYPGYYEAALKVCKKN
jgi:hypothetical protein